MPKPQKIEAADEFRARLQGHILAVVAQYQGITVEQDTELRRKLRAGHLCVKDEGRRMNSEISRAGNIQGISSARIRQGRGKRGKGQREVTMLF